MANRLLTMSRSELLLNCVYPFADALVIPARGRSHSAVYGVAFHEGMEAYLRGESTAVAANKYGIGEIDLHDNVEAAGKRLTEYLGGSNDFGATWPVGDCMLERSFAYDPDAPTARTTAGPDGDHHYVEGKAGELCGTVDLACVSVDKVLLVMDYKTGLTASLESARAQLLSLALALDWLHKPAAVVIAVLHAPRDGIVSIYDERLAPGALAGHRSALFRQMGRVNDGSLRPGSWCEYCPAKPVCPARDADLIVEAHAIVPALMTQAKTLMNRQGESDALAPTEYVGRMHQMISLYDRLRDRLREGIFEEVKRLGYGTRPDGKLLTIEKSSRENLSKSSVERALGKEKGERELQRLRKLGCIETVEREELRAKYEK